MIKNKTVSFPVKVFHSSYLIFTPQVNKDVQISFGDKVVTMDFEKLAKLSEGVRDWCFMFSFLDDIYHIATNSFIRMLAGIRSWFKNKHDVYKRQIRYKGRFPANRLPLNGFAW